MLLLLITSALATPSEACHDEAYAAEPATHWSVGLDSTGDGAMDTWTWIEIADTSLFDALQDTIRPWQALGVVTVELHYNQVDDYFSALWDCAVDDEVEPLKGAIWQVVGICTDCPGQFGGWLP